LILARHDEFPMAVAKELCESLDPGHPAFRGWLPGEKK
jgi:hypothetical protein